MLEVPSGQFAEHDFAWAGLRRSEKGIDLNFYMGDFPTDQPGYNVLVLVSGDNDSFLAVNRQLAMRFGGQGEFTESRLISQVFVDPIFAGLQGEALDLFINASISVLPDGSTVRMLYAAPPLVPAMFSKHDQRLVVIGHLARLAKEGRRRGAKRIVLGAYTKIGGFDRELADLGILPINTGNRLTAVIQGQHILKVCEMHGWDPLKTRVGIIGATGSVGRGLATYLSNKKIPVTLAGRNKARLDSLAGCLISQSANDKIQVVTGNNVLSELSGSCKIIIFLTAHVLFDISDLSASGIHFVDAARPHATPKRFRQLLGDKWFNWLDGGGLVGLLGRHLESNLFHLPWDAMLPCLAEALALVTYPGFDSNFGIEPVGLWDASLPEYLSRLETELKFIEYGAKTAGIQLSSHRTYRNHYYTYELET